MGKASASLFAPEPANRLNSEVKLLRSWDTLLGYEIGQPQLRHLLEVARAENERAGVEPPFAQEFFKLYEREMKN